MRTIDELEQYITWCGGCTKENDLERLWLEWFRAVTCDIESDRLKEICEAERDRRCVVLPCKVGDTVYKIEHDCAESDCPHWHEGSDVFRDDSCCSLDYDEVKPCKLVIKPISMSNITTLLLYLERFGISVFATKEQAEQVLKGGASK